MKIIFVGDLHGKDCWKSIDITQYDKVVFIGDYVDDFTITQPEICENLKAIIKLQKENPEKVVLLIGNHDAQYITDKAPKCSGYNEFWEPIYQEIFDSGNFNYFYNIDKEDGMSYLFSHAGVSNKYAHEQAKGKANMFSVGKARGGSDKVSGILWADKSETESDYSNGLHQVVGHTKVEGIFRVGDDLSSIVYIDCLDTVEHFYFMEI